jgi:prepilin-type processing-associated H-X9-DG protein
MKQKRITGFTLIEIVVVLGAVTVLASILLAVFSRVRERGQRTVCQNNLQQVALAIKQYVADADGYYPVVLYALNKNTAHAKRVEWNDAISPYIKNAAVFRCPRNQLSRDRSATDYGYNHQRLNIWPVSRTEQFTGAHEATLAQAATIPLNMEDTWLDAYGNYIYGGPPITSSCGRSCQGSTIHYGGGNYSFVDGHVKWLTPEQMGEIECSNGPLPFPFTD